MDQVLQKLYYDPSHPAGFAGIHTLYRYAKQKKKSITLDQVKTWLQEQKTYTLHKPIRRRFHRRMTIVAGIDQQWQADLADLQSLAKHNDQFRYLLCVIDVFSRYAWVVPLTDKRGDSLVKAFQSILDTSGRVAKSLQTDKGVEFKNQKFQNFLKSRDIHFFTTENPETKASLVERFQRTLKSRMWKYFTHHKTRRYVDVLPNLVRAYNHSFHRSIQTSPATVTRDNEALISQRFEPKAPRRKQMPVKVGDMVRINKSKKTFEKGYLPNWTTELFKVIKVKKTDPPTVQIEDLGGEKIEGSFYLPEIQRIKDTEIYDIDSVLARRSRKVDGKTIREIKVHWSGYPKKFQSWIPESYLV
jgi:hypothetical protein